MKSFNLIIAIMIVFGSNLFSQSNPIWNIGTKWTYELLNSPRSFSYVTNEIVDTITIDNLKLYEVVSEPVFTGIKYFHFSDSKVYNYDPNSKILQLLYDFDETSSYQTEYRPICDPNFNGDSLVSQSYTIDIDSIDSFLLPDGQTTTIQYTNNEVTRRVLKNIGFMEGYLHHTHDWELGALICDEFGNFVTELRCFESDGIQYNFVGYPCDSTWLKVNTVEEELPAFSVFPNPTHSELRISTDHNGSISYQIRSIDGKLVTQGITNTKSIQVDHLSGVYILRLFINDQWHNTKVLVE